MSIPLAAAGAVLAALLETSVIPGLTSVGRPDLVFIFTVVATMMIGVEDGLTWAFVGGLMTDFLLPGRQLGASALALVLMAGAATAVARVFPQRRLLTTVMTVFGLSLVYQVLTVALLAATGGTPATVDPAAIPPVVIADLILAIPAAALARVFWQRFGAHDRIEW